MSEQLYTIWHGGYIATCESCPPRFVAEVSATSFEAACMQYYEGDDTYNKSNNTYWGMPLFERPEAAEAYFSKLSGNKYND